jgi:hypothetical protein
MERKLTSRPERESGPVGELMVAGSNRRPNAS